MNLLITWHGTPPHYICLGPETTTDLHKITNEPADYMALGPYDFAVGKRHYAGHWKGWAMKVETFLGPETAWAKRELFGLKKFEKVGTDALMFNYWFHDGRATPSLRNTTILGSQMLSGKLRKRDHA